MSDFITPGAKELIESGENLCGNLIFEHLVPKNIYIEKIREAISEHYLAQEFVYEILDKYYYTCTVTVDEDKLLSKTTMPEGWDYNDPFFRYDKIGIKYNNNLHNFRAKEKNDGSFNREN